VVHVEVLNLSVKDQCDDVEFSHPNFVQGQEHLLQFIKRKVGRYIIVVNILRVSLVNFNKYNSG